MADQCYDHPDAAAMTAARKPHLFTHPTMETPRRRARRAITPDEFELLSDEQLERLVPKAYREYFPGKDFCADGYFYLHDGTAWSFFKGGLLDE